MPLDLFPHGYEVLLLSMHLFLRQTCRCCTEQKRSILFIWPPCSSHNAMFGKLQALSSVPGGQKRIYSGNPSNVAVVMEVALDGAFWNLVTPRHHQGLQFFHCDPWEFCCFSHHSPQYLGGHDAVASIPMRFSTVPYLFNFFIIALTVLSGIFNRLLIFL